MSSTNQKKKTNYFPFLPPSFYLAFIKLVLLFPNIKDTTIVLNLELGILKEYSGLLDITVFSFLCFSLKSLIIAKAGKIESNFTKAPSLAPIVKKNTANKSEITYQYRTLLQPEHFFEPEWPHVTQTSSSISETWAPPSPSVPIDMALLKPVSTKKYCDASFLTPRKSTKAIRIRTATILKYGDDVGSTACI